MFFSEVSCQNWWLHSQGRETSPKFHYQASFLSSHQTRFQSVFKEFSVHPKGFLENNCKNGQVAWLKINPPSRERWNSIAILVYRRVRTPFFSSHQILTYSRWCIAEKIQTHCSSLSAIGNVTALPAPSFAPAGVVVRHSPSPTVFFRSFGSAFLTHGIHVDMHPSTKHRAAGHPYHLFVIRKQIYSVGWSWWPFFRINLAKWSCFNNLDFAEIRGPISFPKRHRFLGGPIQLSFACLNLSFVGESPDVSEAGFLWR